MSPTPPPIPSNRPPPLPPEGRELFEQCARASWMSILIALVANIGVHMAGNPANAHTNGVVSAIFAAVIAFVGIVGGIVALFGVRRHGRAGILWPAVTGLCVWALLAALAVPAFTRARRMALLNRPTILAPATLSPSAKRVQDAEIGFAFDLPEGFEAMDRSAMPKEYRYAFLKRAPAGLHRAIGIKSLGGTLPRKRLKPEEIPVGKSVALTSFNWRGLQLDSIRVIEKIGNEDYLTINVQVPLRKEAIQFAFGGPPGDEVQIRSLAEKLLSSLDGDTNW